MSLAVKPRVRVRSGKVVFGLVDKPPNQRLITHLETLTSYAREGKMRSIMDVVEWDDGSCSEGWQLSPQAREYSLLGSLHVLMESHAFDHTRHYDHLYPGECW